MSRRRAAIVCLGLMLTSGLFSPAYARLWGIAITPTVSVSQTYSDNLTLGRSGFAFVPSGQPQGGFVTQLNPGINITREGARSKFNLSYRLQSLFYEGVDIDPRVFNQLQMNSVTELYDDTLFVDSSSTIGQANASSIGAYSPDNIFQSSNINSTTYTTFRLSPYWKPHLGGYADALVRVSYTNFGNSNTTGNLVNQNQIGNLGADTYQQSIHMVSGRKFNSTGMNWRLSINNQEQDYRQRETGNVRFRSYNGELSYRLINDVSAFVQAGYYDNDFPTRAATRNTRNGVYVTPGLSWTPSPNFSLAAGYGINAYFSNLNWRPSQRTSFQLSYRNSQVGGSNYGQAGFGGGLGTSGGIAGFDYNSVSAGGFPGTNSPTGALGAPNAGSIWNGNLSHRTRSTLWTASYYTQTTTIQQLLTNLATFTTPTDLDGNPTGDPFANDRAINLPDLNNNLITTKRAQISASWFLSRASLMLSAHHNDISYSSTISRPQDIFGVTASWNWRFSPRTSATVQGSWQSSEFQSNSNLGATTGKTEFLTAGVIITRQISNFISSSLQYQHIETNSSGLTNFGTVLGPIPAYDANRVTASILVRF